MTRLTAMEMFNNPYDLSIGVKITTGKYALTICRGREHNYKPLITSKPWMEKFDDILEIVERLLTSARNFCVNELKTGEDEECLSLNLIQIIMQKLRERQEVDTYDLMPVDLVK